MRKSKEDSLFEAVVWEAAKEKSRLLEERKKEWEQVPISENSRRRFEAMLDAKFSGKQGRRNTAHRSRKTSKRFFVAAAAGFIIIAMLALPVVTSAEIAERFTKLVGQVFSRFTQYQLENDDAIVAKNKRYEANYIPKGYNLIDKNNEELYYENAVGENFCISVQSSNAAIQVNTENASIEKVSIWGEEGQVVFIDNWTYVIWSAEDMIICVDGTAGKGEILKIAENIKIKS